MRILCVDDDPAILELLGRVLGSAGHQVVGCGSGAAALRRIVLESFDLLVADMMLPDLRGVDVIRAWKAQSPSLPAIGISANQDAAVEAEFIDAGVGRFLSKPFRIADLLGEVRLIEGLKGRLRLLLAGAVAGEQAFVRALRQEGFVVTAVEGREEALGALRQQPVDVIVCEDAAYGATAAEFLTWRRAAPGREQVVVVVVAGPDTEDHRMLEAGASLCLRRPLDAAPLAALLHFMGPQAR